MSGRRAVGANPCGRPCRYPDGLQPRFGPRHDCQRTPRRHGSIGMGRHKGVPYEPVPTAQAPSVASRKFVCFRVSGTRQCKAQSAGYTGRIGKGCNAAVARSARSRRARATWPVAALRPLAMEPPFPADRALPQTTWRALKSHELAGHDTRGLSDLPRQRRIRRSPRAAWAGAKCVARQGGGCGGGYGGATHLTGVRSR